jgi:hypothetical protein
VARSMGEPHRGLKKSWRREEEGGEAEGREDGGSEEDS